MNNLLTLEDVKPTITLDGVLDITPEQVIAADLELRRSPNLVTYLQKIHLHAYAEIGKIPSNGDANDFRVRYAKIQGRLTALEALLIELPRLADDHRNHNEDVNQ